MTRHNDVTADMTVQGVVTRALEEMLQQVTTVTLSRSDGVYSCAATGAEGRIEAAGCPTMPAAIMQVYAALAAAGEIPAEESQATPSG